MTSGVDLAYAERVDRAKVRRIGVRFILAVLALNVAVVIGGEIFAPSSEGPRGSTFSTEADGSAAWLELLDSIGIDARQHRAPAADAAHDPASSVLVILDPASGQTRDVDVDAVERFVRAGGRVITTAGNEFTRRLIPDLTRNRADVQTAGSVTAGPELGDARTVRFASATYFSDIGSIDRLLETSSGLPVAVGADVGEGRVVALVDSSPVSNELIDEADNAAFAVGITGGRMVIFDEYVHGYGLGQGVGGLPAALSTLAMVLILAAVLWIWATGRRLGEPEQAARALPPARIQFIDAMGATLARTEPGETGFGDLRMRGLELFERYAHGRTEAGSGVAASLGLTEWEVAALQQPAASRSAIEAIGSAVAKLERLSAGEGLDAAGERVNVAPRVEGPQPSTKVRSQT